VPSGADHPRVERVMAGMDTGFPEGRAGGLSSQGDVHGGFLLR
jgi:hypothetical protein